MDCIEAREIISEAFDRGVGDTARAADARRHCRTCPECRTFVEGLAILQKTQPPKAPPELVDAIVERGRKLAETGAVRVVTTPVVAAEDGAEPEAPAGERPDDTTAAPVFELPPTAARRTEVRDRWWWGTRIAGTAAAIVIAAFAVSLAAEGFHALRGGTARTAGSATSGSLPSSGADSSGRAMGGAAPAAAPEATQATKSGATASMDAIGPRYIDIGGRAYVWMGQRTPDRETLESAGSVTTSLEDSGTPASYDVWRSKGDPDVFFIRTDPSAETYLAFRGVTRSLGGKTYALSSGAGLPAFGVWPSLPTQFTKPTAMDGSPTFVEAGKDDTGLTIYAPPNDKPDAGFAVAPGTAPTDPAGGNPEWTWWVPK